MSQKIVEVANINLRAKFDNKKLKEQEKARAREKLEMDMFRQMNADAFGTEDAPEAELDTGVRGKRKRKLSAKMQESNEDETPQGPQVCSLSYPTFCKRECA